MVQPNTHLTNLLYRFPPGGTPFAFVLKHMDQEMSPEPPSSLDGEQSGK